MTFLLLFIAVIVVNILPAFAPPTWTLLVFFLVEYKLPLPQVILLGVFGATIGRFILSQYIDWFAEHLFNKKEEENLQFLGEKIGSTPITNILFTFLYSLTPLSTTALFVAAGVAKVRILYVLIGFFFGRFISYTLLALSTRVVATNINNLFDGVISLESLLSAIAGLGVIFLFIFIDWKVLFKSKKLRLNFAIWKWNG
jgi:membrane protein YqaA with SNARE-associated domain